MQIQIFIKEQEDVSGFPSVAISDYKSDTVSFRIYNPMVKSRLLSRTLLAFFFIIFCLSTTYSQKKREVLEQKKKENLEKIKELNDVLDKTETKKEATLGQLKTLNERITSQSRQIDLLSENQQLLEGELSELNRVTRQLNGNLGKLKAEYAKMIYQSAKPSNAYNKLSFLFSSPNFNLFVMRYKWLKQYTQARRSQVRLMENVRNSLLSEQQKVQLKRVEQSQVLASKLTESKSLENLKIKQTVVVGKLSKQETQIRQQLEENKQAIDRLENQISSLVEREIRKSQQRERAERAERITKDREEQQKEERLAKKDTDNREEKPEVKGLSDEETALASSFAASKTHLPWPVKGFISERFGIHSYDIPGLKNVKYENHGVNIQASAGSSVKAVYDGVVRDVTSIQGMNSVVAIQHGEFFTIYSKMANVNVHVGQKVKAREVIGAVAAGNDGTSELQFQIWRNANKMNPENWLIAR